MDKGTKKTNKLKYNNQVIDVLEQKYGVTRYYIRQSIAGRRDGILPDKLRKEYRSLDKVSQKAITNKIKSDL